MLPDWYFEEKAFIEWAIQEYMEKYLSQFSYWVALSDFKEAVNYALKWWKRIRAILALEFYLLFSWRTFQDIQKEDDIMKFCIALECIHAYSLVHDDLPAMDNDEYRRGELTTWKKFWEANGVLVWDMLNTFALEIVSEISDPVIALQLVKKLSFSTWFFWMVGWQVEDLYFEEKISELTLEQLIELHNKKTGALISTSVLGWILLANPSNIDLNIFQIYAKNIWLAFQIKDDVLDVEWTFEETGKSVGWEKKGFVYFLWLEKSKEYLNEITKTSIGIIQNYSALHLQYLTEYISIRTK